MQTVGCVVFSRIDVDENGQDPHFHFRKEHHDDMYNPKDSEQSLRYLLRFLLRLHFDNRARSWTIFRFLYDWFLDKHLKDAVTTSAEGYKDSGEFEVVQGHISLLLGRYYGKPALQVTGLAASTRRITNDGSLSFHQTRYLGKTSMDDLQPTNDHPLGGELSPQYPA